VIDMTTSRTLSGKDKRQTSECLVVALRNPAPALNVLSQLSKFNTKDGGLKLV
jgi:hypothetical protein